MHTYQIRYKKGLAGAGPRIVKADTVNGFKPTCDTFIFKVGAAVVAAIPKVNVISVQMIEDPTADDPDLH